MGLQSLRASSSKDTQSSKSERKFEKKLQFYSKVRETVASLSVKKTISKKKKLRSRQKKLKAYDLSSLSEVLPESKPPRQVTVSSDAKLKCKSRQELVVREAEHLRAVLNDPAFKLDPFAAIHQHLLSTQPILDEKPEKKLSKNGSKKKGKKSKALSGSQAMEI